jgi:hypothetical protein
MTGSTSVSVSTASLARYSVISARRTSVHKGDPNSARIASSRIPRHVTLALVLVEVRVAGFDLEHVDERPGDLGMRRGNRSSELLEQIHELIRLHGVAAGKSHPLGEFEGHGVLPRVACSDHFGPEPVVQREQEVEETVGYMGCPSPFVEDQAAVLDLRLGLPRDPNHGVRVDARCSTAAKALMYSCTAPGT